MVVGCIVHVHITAELKTCWFLASAWYSRGIHLEQCHIIHLWWVKVCYPVRINSEQSHYWRDSCFIERQLPEHEEAGEQMQWGWFQSPNGCMWFKGNSLTGICHHQERFFTTDRWKQISHVVIKPSHKVRQFKHHCKPGKTTTVMMPKEKPNLLPS